VAVCHRLGLFDIVNLFGEPPFLFSGGTSLTLEKRGVRLLSGHCDSGGLRRRGDRLFLRRGVNRPAPVQSIRDRP